ncbi:MltF family protein [Microbulbifer pacificus]|uniref:Transporter substrate-binding domain-containing protein n=1 Tax=Microbulbifer pacificus TaxID=407164 RepID=A0AAU0N3B1_9GAMM|nr:transporter substrate-binding domain-containing protein [Microbulbifer pacificus]WOX06614.1 transporter substrate-binding domain-containing protein [Microbulbifer pacificus]
MDFPAFRRLLCCLIILLPVTVACQRDTQSPSSEKNIAEQTDAANGETAGTSTEDTDETGLRAANNEDVRPEAAWPPETSGEYPINAYNNYVETGDLDAIKKRGKLRILVDIANVDSLHREATQQDIELEETKRLAKHLGLEPVVLYANSFDQLIPLLQEGKGDIIANNMVVTESRKQQVDFSIPTAKTHFILVSRSDFKPVTAVADLKGKTLEVTKGTAYEALVRAYAERYPGLEFKVSEKNYVELVIAVAEGLLDFTVVEQQIYDLVSQFKDNLQKNYVFPEEREMAWAMRKDSPELAKAVNDFIRQSKLSRSIERSVGDLDKIRERGYIRFLTRNHPGTYFMWKGRIMGYEFELAEAFAKELKLRLEIVVAPTHEDLLNMLRDGKADVAASLISITERRMSSGMAFGPPYMNERVVVVGRDGDNIASLEDLAGRTIFVRKSSSHYDVAMELQKKVPGVKIELAPEELNIQQIIDRVADKEYDLAIADDISVKLENAWRTNIVELIDLQQDDNTYAWMVRDSNPELLKAIEKFFHHKSTKKLQKTLYTKYFDSPKRTRPEINELNADGTISPFDKHVKKYAEEFDFDWRLVVAQMFQESTFNPKAKSWVGARGLMQVMPDTGKQVGEKNLFDPETSVRAGMKYLEWLHRKFEDKDISPENMMWFTLAAYNAGLGHVYDAQDLAEEKGWDRRVWFDNVENAMLLLSEKKYYKNARFGYARGQEPYDYVRKIQARYRTYVALLEDYERRNADETSGLLDLVYPGFYPAAFRSAASLVQ